MTIDPTLYTTRPHGPRPAGELACYDLLEALAIPFVRVDHDATPSIDACREVEELLGIAICKNLFLTNRQRSRFYLLMMPGGKAFHTRELSAQIGSSRLSFASEDDMVRLLGLTPGSVSVLGLRSDQTHEVQLLIDRDVLAMDAVGCHPCVNTASLKLRMEDLLTKFLPHTGHEPVVVTLVADAAAQGE